MCMGKGCIEKTKNILSEKSQQYLMNLRLKEGMEYSNLILDECKGILFHNQSGYCFTEKQLHDIKQVCLFEKTEIIDSITYNNINKDDIDYITIIKKEVFNNKKVPKRCYTRKTNIRKNKKGTDLKKSIESQVVSFDDLKQQILEHYEFNTEEQGGK